MLSPRGQQGGSVQRIAVRHKIPRIPELESLQTHCSCKKSLESDFVRLLLIKKGVKMNSFRSLLLEIGQQLTTAQLDNLKFACIDFIPAGRAEFILQPHSLFLEMERQNKLSENNRNLLATLLQGIGRADLKNKLLEIQG